jgi:hypothetical protein
MLTTIIAWNHVISFDCNFEKLVLQLAVITASEWNDELVLTFIEGFKKYRCLRDPKDTTSKTRTKRTKRRQAENWTKRYETRNMHSVELCAAECRRAKSICAFDIVIGHVKSVSFEAANVRAGLLRRLFTSETCFGIGYYYLCSEPLMYWKLPFRPSTFFRWNLWSLR